MSNTKLDEFRKIVESDFKKHMSETDVIEKYGIVDAADHVKNKPSRATIYNWGKEWRNLQNSKKNTAVKLDENLQGVENPRPQEGPSEPPASPSQTTSTGEGFGSFIRRGQIPGPDEKLDFTEPVFSQAPSDYPELKFIKLLANLPGQGVSDGFEAAFLKKGVDLNKLPLINYAEWRTLQVSSAEALVKKVTGGLITPEWMRALVPWYPAIDLMAAYGVPTGIAIADTLLNRKGKKPAEEPQKEQKQV